MEFRNFFLLFDRKDFPFLGAPNPEVQKSEKSQKKSWEPVDPVVADPVRQDNDKRNNIQTNTEILFNVHRRREQNFPIFISCRYLVELGLGELGLPVAERQKRVKKESQRARNGSVACRDAFKPSDWNPQRHESLHAS